MITEIVVLKICWGAFVLCLFCIALDECFRGRW